MKKHKKVEQASDKILGKLLLKSLRKDLIGILPKRFRLDRVHNVNLDSVWALHVRVHSKNQVNARFYIDDQANMQYVEYGRTPNLWHINYPTNNIKHRMSHSVADPNLQNWMIQILEERFPEDSFTLTDLKE